MRKLLISILVILIPIFMISSCKKNSTESTINSPTVTTTNVSNITITAAQGGGNVTADGGAAVTARGICWSTSNNPTTSDNTTTDSTGTGSFTSEITGLTEATTYYVRAYATNSEGTAYGDTVSFTTGSILIPEVTTANVSNITNTTAQCGGTVTSDGGGSISTRGICWSTSETPTISDENLQIGSGIGSFARSINGLIANTIYYVRAYATNSAGTGYGDNMSFTTLQLPEVTTAEVSNIMHTTAQCGGTVTTDNGLPVTARGVCWSTNSVPTVSDNITTDGTGVGSYTSNMTGLTPNTNYYARAYATNSAGTGYGNIVSFNPITTVTDINGNVYQTVVIGNQVWMAENLKVTHNRYGNPMSLITNDLDWENANSASFCYYGNNSANIDTYGLLYNFIAAVSSIAPEGWHVPSDEEWQILVDSLGGDLVAGGKMKETGTAHWVSPNTGATNESGFTALPGGFRNQYGGFDYLGGQAIFWSSTNDSGWGLYRLLHYHGSDIYRNNDDWNNGFSIRCVRD